MDLYIRSQDRLILEKYETLQLCQNPDGTWFFNSGLVLGKYKTKERALEVLDEIHQRLIDLQILEVTNDYRFTGKRNLDCVYHMPQD